MNFPTRQFNFGANEEKKYISTVQGCVWSLSLLGWRIKSRTVHLMRQPPSSNIQYDIPTCACLSIPFIPLLLALSPHAATVKVINPECSLTLAEGTQTYMTQQHTHTARRPPCNWDFTQGKITPLLCPRSNYSRKVCAAHEQISAALHSQSSN